MAPQQAEIMDEAQAFEAFVRQHEAMVYTTSRRLVRREEDAADIAQTVFLKAYERFEELRNNPRAGAWLRVAARHLSLNHLQRYRQRWRFFSEMEPDDTGTSFEELTPGTTDTAFRQLIDTEKHRLLETALASLPEHQRIPLILFHFEEMAYEAIAQQLGRSLSKIKSDIHRGRLALRQILEKEKEQ